MMSTERSTGMLLLSLVAIALLGTALVSPWLSYESSSGRRTPEGGFQDPNDTGIIRHSITMSPAQVKGDEPASHPEEATQYTKILQWALIAAMAMLGLAALGGIPWVCRWIPRWLALWLVSLGALTTVAALAIGWVWLPGTLDGYGVTGPFTARLIGETYIRTSLELGWIAAGLSVPVAVVAFAAQFQAGSTDPALIEAVARSGRHA